MVINSTSSLFRFRHSHQSFSPLSPSLLSSNLSCNQTCTSNGDQLPQRSPFGIQQLLGLENNSTQQRTFTAPNTSSSSSSSASCANRLDGLSSSSFSSLSVSNLLSTNVPSNQSLSSNYIASKNSSHSNHPVLIASHHPIATTASGHCFSDPATRLAYLNSPAAAALMSASIQASSNSSAAAACMASNVPASMSMLHSFSNTNLDPSLAARNDHTCSGKHFILHYIYLFARKPNVQFC